MSADKASASVISLEERLSSMTKNNSSADALKVSYAAMCGNLTALYTQMENTKLELSSRFPEVAGPHVLPSETSMDATCKAAEISSKQAAELSSLREALDFLMILIFFDFRCGAALECWIFSFLDVSSPHCWFW